MFTYTPILRATGERLRITRPVFSPGFDLGPGRKKGLVFDKDTGVCYQVTGKACGLKCFCDSWADAIAPEGEPYKEMAARAAALTY